MYYEKNFIELYECVVHLFLKEMGSFCTYYSTTQFFSLTLWASFQIHLSSSFILIATWYSLLWSYQTSFHIPLSDEVNTLNFNMKDCFPKRLVYNSYYICTYIHFSSISPILNSYLSNLCQLDASLTNRKVKQVFTS